MMDDSVILLLTTLGALVFSFIVVTFCDTEGITDDALSRDLNQICMQMTTLSVSIIFSPLQEIAAMTIAFAALLLTRVKWVVAFVLFFALTLLIHYYHASILNIIDDGWTCALVPIMKNVVTPLLQVTRIVYALFIPIINAFIVLHGQVFKAWYITAVNCNHNRFLTAVGEGALAVQAFSSSTAGFFGSSSINEQEGGNFMTNDFEFGPPLHHAMKALSLMEDVAICACTRFELVFNLLFIAIREPHVVAALDNFYQIFVRVGQSLFSIVEGKLPDIYLINFKYERFLVETGMAMDSIMLKAGEKILYELSVGLSQGTAKEKEKNAFVLKNRPLEGPFTIAAHHAAALWHVATTIGVNGPLHLMSIFDNKHQTSFDVEMWSMGKALSQLHKAVYAQAALLQWLTYVVKTFVQSPDNALTILKEETIPLDISCNWVDDVATYRNVPLHETVGCSYYYYGLYTWNMPFILWGVVVELMVKTVFSNNQNMFRTLQRWEGPALARDTIYTCEERTDATAFDYTDSSYHATGWIWTQDRSQCQCNLYYGSTLNEDEPMYNPWCGQPSLNFDIFAPLDALIMHVSHGLLGPGFGDAFPFVEPVEGVGIKVEGPNGEMVNKFIKFPRALPPLTRTAVESMRVLLRVAFSWNDIVTGHWFNYPVNCGHGLNNLQIETKYNATKEEQAVEWSALSAQQQIEMRWHGCDVKKYVSSSSKLKICDDNESSDCMCSYLKPLSASSPCKCIARYPDLDVTTSTQEVGDLIDDRFTSAEVSQHWCNSLIIEWTFQNTGAFADALDYIVSLGPINPTCDVMDRAFNGESLASDNPDSRSKSTYLLANTPTLKFAGEFMSSETKLQHIKDLYPFKEISDFNVVDLHTDDTQAGCRIWGRFDFFCSAGLYVRNSKRLTMNIGRQVVHNGISIMAGNYADINFDTLPRMCDYERQQGAIAAMIAGLIPNVRIGMKKALAKYINMVIQVLYIQSTRTVLVLGKMATTIVMNFKELTKDSLMETFKSGMETIVDGYLWAFIYFWESTGELLNEIKPNSGKICDSVVKILETVRAELKKGLLDLAGQVLELLGQLVAALTGNQEVIGPMFENAFKLWADIQLILVKRMWSILGAVFDFFTVNGEGKEGFGVILKLMASKVCELLNTVMGTINSLLGGMVGWEDSECLEMNTDGRRRLTEEIDMTQKIAETLEWNGTSVCDHFMTEVAQYKYVELRPLEKATWLECIEYKYLGIQLQSLLGSKKFPTDMFYNWKRKYLLAFDSLYAMKIILEHYTMVNNREWGKIRLIMTEKGIDADLYLKLVQTMYDVSGKLINAFHLTNLVETSLSFFDPEYQNKANPSETAQVWRTYSSFKTVAETTSSEWVRGDMTQQVYAAKDAMMEVNQHLHKWWASVGESDASSTHTMRTFGNLKRAFSSPLKKTTRRTKLKSPIITSVKTCRERGNGVSPTWCTSCNIMDNAVEAVIMQTNGLSDFYTNTKYGLPFVIENVTNYFDRLAEYNSDFFETTLTKLSSAAPTISTDEIRWTFYVARDWEQLGSALWTYVSQWESELWLGQVDKFLNASRDFATITDSTYIPFFGYSFFHMYDYILFSSCNLEESVFVTTTTQEKRLLQMDNAILACSLLILLILSTTTWSVIPLAWMANTIVIAILVNFLYLYMVYGYMIACYPLSPYTLVEDMNAWYHTRLDPGCFYKTFPHLAINASEETCLTCPMTEQSVNVQTYIDCATYVSKTTTANQLTLPEFMEEYFIFWPMIFWIRRTFPNIGTQVVEWGIFSFDSVIGKLALSAYQGEPVDHVWIECSQVMWLDNVFAGLLLLIAVYIALKMTIIALQTSIQVAILAMYTYTSLGYLSLTIEMTVVEKAKLQ
jgi:hypothetical protein